MASHLRTTEYHTNFLQPENNQAHLYLIPASKAGTRFNNNNNNTLIYIAPACRMTSEALIYLLWTDGRLS